VLPIFELMQQIGNVAETEMYRTFNMGVGMVVVCAPEAVETVKSHFQQRGQVFYEMGHVTKGDREVSIK
jgi:phosphoribosylformylglycinamidine cyclo-ligase